MTTVWLILPVGGVVGGGGRAGRRLFWQVLAAESATAIEEGRDLSSMSGILADRSYRLLPA
jgi:hypothetical protein